MKKTVRILSLVLAAVLLSSACALAAAADTSVSFVDVEKDRWSFSDIEYAVEKGFLKGVGGGRFAPADTCTRAMVVTVLYRAEGEPKVGSTLTFTDVDDDEWYTGAVIWAQTNSVVKGTTDTTFEPDSEVTREQLATFFYRYATFKKYKLATGADLSKFSDGGAVSSYALKAVKWAVAIGLIKGMDDGTVEPGGSATREQFAAIMGRFDKHHFRTSGDNELPAVPIG